MLIVLCALDDLDTLAFVRRIRRGGFECQILTAEALSFARRRSQRLSTRGGLTVETTIDAHPLPVLDDRRMTGVLNRLVEAPGAAWHFAQPEEQGYALAELHAFVLSWLSGLRCPVLNRPSGESLAGPIHHPVVVQGAAHRAGLPTRAARWDPDNNSLTSGRPPGRVVTVPCLDGVPVQDGLPANITCAIPALLKSLDLQQAFVGVQFAVTETGWHFTGLNTRPPLPGADSPLFRSLLELLTPEGART